MPRPVRSTAFYRLVLALPSVAFVYLAVSGRLSAYWGLFKLSPGRPIDPAAFDSAFVTGLVWMAAVSPLLFAAWEIGRDHTAARRRGYDLLLGFREVVRRAFGREPVQGGASDPGAPPRDNPRRAFALGAGTAVLLPAFFAGVLPMLRTPRALAWLFGAGILMGSLTYARYRAMAYLRDEPRRFDLFREYRLMNTDRYEQAGHPFVRWQLIGLVLLMIWWLGVGSLVLFSG